MKTKTHVFFSLSILVFLAITIISCNSNCKKESEETKEIKEEPTLSPEEQTNQELAMLEKEAPSKEAPMTRSGSGSSSSYNHDDECNKRCEHILDKMATIFNSGTLEREYRSCMEQCMEDKAKELAEQEALQEKEECERTKAFILEQAQDNFMRCINAAGTESDKEICREQYRQDKNFYYNYCK